MNKLTLEQRVFLMKEKNKITKPTILKKINGEKTLTGKCIMAREYLSPQSTDFEKIIREDLKICKKIDETSGDGNKNGKNYEIKHSIHAKKSKLNFVQIRPDHNIDFYIFIGYNMYKCNTHIGKAYIFKIPHDKINKLIVEYGGYAHGTVKIFGKITKDNIIGRNCEYALRCDPNAVEKTKSFKLWKEFMKYSVDYNPDNF